MMNVSSICAATALLMAMTGCGFWVAVDEFEDDPTSESTPVEENKGEKDQRPSLWEEETQSGVKFEGYVMSAFAVSVDGKDYDDMEHFYTDELARLPEKIKAAGYEGDYDIELQAQVGISDLWHNMKVYIAPSEPTGFQVTTSVNANGHYAALLPKKALDKDYKVRALKRISLVLKNDTEITRICYNFSAVEQQIFFDGEGEPTILDNFETKITAYDCPAVKESGLSVPGKTPTEKDVLVPLEEGQTKAEVQRIMGVEGIFIASPQRMCWANQENKTPRCQVDLGGEEPCQCWVDFDEDGIVESFENISLKFLGID